LTGYERRGEFTFDGPKLDILWTADWHLGSLYANHELMLKHFEAILKAEGVVLAVVGDAIDNFHSIKLLAPTLQQVFSPTEQKIMLLSILRELVRAGKLLFFVLGNHETFSERSGGDSFFQLLDTASVPIANDRFEASVTVGGYTYLIDAMHKAKGSSITNNQHGNMRNLIHNSPHADIIVSGHKHSPGYEFTRKYGSDKYLITVGTYKGDDDYSWSGWPNGQGPFFPITRLSGEEKKVRMIHGIEELQ